MKKPRNMQELKKMAQDRKSDKKEVVKEMPRHAKMMSLMEQLMGLMQDRDMEEMEDEKRKESSPTVKSAK